MKIDTTLRRGDIYDIQVKGNYFYNEGVNESFYQKAQMGDTIKGHTGKNIKLKNAGIIFSPIYRCLLPQPSPPSSIKNSYLIHPITPVNLGNTGRSLTIVTSQIERIMI
jgi:hypothetical protein